MSHALPYILTETSVTIIIDDNPITVDYTDPNWESIINAIHKRDWDAISILANKSAAVEEFGKGLLTVTDGAVYYNNMSVHNHVVDRIFDFIHEDIDIDPLVNFLDKLLVNSSKRCIDELFAFMEHGNMPLDPDGDFYAYKAVRNDWMDKHSGTMHNRIGDVVEMPRNAVDDNSTHACSHGLHAGSLQYVKGFANNGDKIIIVKINPKDVVSVPCQEDNKMRCCRYEVIAEYTGPLPETVWTESDNCACDCDY